MHGRESDSGAIGSGRRWFHVEQGVRVAGDATTPRRRVLPGLSAYRFTLATLRLLLADTVSLLVHMGENDRAVAIGMRRGQALGARPLKGPAAARRDRASPARGSGSSGYSSLRLTH